MRLTAVPVALVIPAVSSTTLKTPVLRDEVPAAKTP